jgi:predicted DNA-binding transcriptional regulator AlpA
LTAPPTLHDSLTDSLDPALGADDQELLESSEAYEDAFTNRRNIDIQTASSILGYSVATVRRMISQGKLKRAPHSDDRVTSASVREFLAKRKAPKKEGTQPTTPVPLIARETLVDGSEVLRGNGHHHATGDTPPYELPALTID